MPPTPHEDPPLISVVMAFHLGVDETDFAASLRSAVGQTHPEVELILVGDGPAARELEPLVRRVVPAPFPLTVHYTEQQTGPARTRNEGIERARGEYIAIWDSDDESVPDRLARQLAFLLREDLDLASAFLEERIGDGTSGSTIKTVPTATDDVRRRALWRNPVNNPAVFAKAGVLQANPYPTNFVNCEDYHLWITLLSQGKRIGNLPDPLVNFTLSSSFVDRRRGLTWALNEWKVKCHARRLLPAPLRPLWLALTPAFFFARLLPPWFLSTIYRSLRR